MQGAQQGGCEHAPREHGYSRPNVTNPSAIGPPVTAERCVQSADESDKRLVYSHAAAYVHGCMHALARCIVHQKAPGAVLTPGKHFDLKLKPRI